MSNTCSFQLKQNVTIGIIGYNRLPNIRIVSMLFIINWEKKQFRVINTVSPYDKKRETHPKTAVYIQLDSLRGTFSKVRVSSLSLVDRWAPVSVSCLVHSFVHCPISLPILNLSNMFCVYSLLGGLALCMGYLDFY